ncbi:MAG: L-alanine-DL-glutamate epimerase [Sphaerochaeta sp.]|nr:L-alanine-DL-glutamate epimerase [Sphaerochaeta sp.]
MSVKIYFDFNEKISFSKAIYYNFNPIPVKKPWRDATGGFGNFLPLQGWIDLYDSEGYHGSTFCSRGMIDNILPLILTGESKTYKEWYTYVYWKFRNFGFQSGQISDLGQFDFIMLDLLSKRNNLPMHRFLGADKDWADAYKGGGSLLSSDEALVDDMVRYVDEGYKVIKFKVGSDFGQNMNKDIARLEKVRKAVGSDIAIAIDGNQVWNIDEAMQFAKMTTPYSIAWYEEPVHSHDMNAIKELKNRGLKIPIGYGESMRNYYSFETYVEKGVDHLMPLVGRISKMSDLLAIRDLANRNNLMFSSGGNVYINAVFGALYNENELLEIHEPMVGPIGEYLSIKSTEKNGKIYLPDIVGAPLRIDIDKLEKDMILESVKYYYMSDSKKQFAVRGSY